MMALYAPKPSWSLRGTLLPAPAGRHRRGPAITLKLGLMIAGYVALWAALSTAARLAAVR